MTKDIPFGSLVRHRRVELGMSQAGLADLVGRSASAVRSWERGSSTPTDDGVVRSLAAILGLDEGELRTAVGMPADGIAQEDEEVGGKGLLAFAEQAVEDGAEAQSVAGEISWDDVAESVRGGAEQRSPAELSEAEAPGVDDPHDEHPADEAEGAEPEGSPGDELGTEAAEEEPMVPSKEPAKTAAEPDPIPVPATGRAQTERTGPLLPTATTATSRTTVMPVSEPAAPPAANSYLDDPDQMMTYWIRAALTVALTMFLLIVLFWALGNLSDSVGEVWDLIKTAS